MRLGEWQIDPQDGSLRSSDNVRRLEPQLMGLLVYLVSRAGTVVSKQEIVDAVWAGAAISDETLTSSIYQVRKALGDDARPACLWSFRRLARVARRHAASPERP
jgi:transcriptional activator of cad operon